MSLTGIPQEEIENIEQAQGKDEDTQENIRKGTRVRTLTDKGRNHQVEIFTKKFSASRTRINKQCELLSQVLATNNYEVVQQELTNLDKFFSEAEEHHLKLVEILPEDEQLNHQEEREYIDSQVFEMKRIACVWLTQNEPSPSQRSSRASSRSGSRRASSKSSSHSSKHSSSRHSEKSKSSSQIEDLKREEKGLQKLQQAKTEEMEQRMRLESAKIQTEKAELQLKFARAKLEDDPEENELPNERPKPSKKVPHKKEPHKKDQSHEDNMLTIITKLVNLHTAPAVDIDIFSKDPLDYAYFRAAFKEVVEEKVSDPRGKLTRLLKYTSGDAKDLIKHCIHETKNDCFEMAIQLLDKEYGNKQLLVNHYLNKLRNWPKISPNNSSAYKKLHRFLLSGLIYKRDGNLSELDSETVIRSCVLSKMDRAVQGKWLNKVV